MSRSTLLRAALLAAFAALCALEPALAFDPQPDPPVAWWDPIFHIWRLIIVR